MALTQAQYIALVNDRFADNTTQEISEADLREVALEAAEIFFPGTSTGSLNLAYDNGRTYDITLDGEFLYAEYDNKLWKWINVVPGNVTPVEGASWTEVSKSAGSAFVEWMFEAVYAEGLIVVFFEGRLYQLLEVVRPFQTVDLPVELGLGKWLDLSTELPAGLPNETIRYNGGSEPISSDALQNDGTNIIIKTKVTSPLIAIKNIGNFLGNLFSTLVTSDRNYELPDKDGTFAMISDVNDAVTGAASIQGDYNASTNTPDLDTAPSGILKGYLYVVTVAGNFFAEAVDAGDSLIAKIDNPVALADWIRIEKNNDYTLARVLALANATGGSDVVVSAGDKISSVNGGFTFEFVDNFLGSDYFLLGKGGDGLIFIDGGYVGSVIGGSNKWFVDPALSAMGLSPDYDLLFTGVSNFNTKIVRGAPAAAIIVTLPSITGTLALKSDLAPIKSGQVLAVTFSGNPKKATVTFATPFSDANYSVSVIGEDGRAWTIESKVAASFIIDTNSNSAPSFPVMWTAIKHGEYN